MASNPSIDGWWQFQSAFNKLYNVVFSACSSFDRMVACCNARNSVFNKDLVLAPVCAHGAQEMDAGAVSWGTCVRETSTGPLKGFLMGGEGVWRNKLTWTENTKSFALALPIHT